MGEIFVLLQTLTKTVLLSMLAAGVIAFLAASAVGEYNKAHRSQNEKQHKEVPGQ